MAITAPASASASAIALPIPRDAPVTSATRLKRSDIAFLLDSVRSECAIGSRSFGPRRKRLTRTTIGTRYIVGPTCNQEAGLNLDLDTLRAFAVAHDRGGLAQAAEHLGRTPSA